MVAKAVENSAGKDLLEKRVDENNSEKIVKVWCRHPKMEGMVRDAHETVLNGCLNGSVYDFTILIYGSISARANVYRSLKRLKVEGREGRGRVMVEGSFYRLVSQEIKEVLQVYYHHKSVLPLVREGYLNVLKKYGGDLTKMGVDINSSRATTYRDLKTFNISLDEVDRIRTENGKGPVEKPVKRKINRLFAKAYSLYGEELTNSLERKLEDNIYENGVPEEERRIDKEKLAQYKADYPFLKKKGSSAEVVIDLFERACKSKVPRMLREEEIAELYGCDLGLAAEVNVQVDASLKSRFSSAESRMERKRGVQLGLFYEVVRVLLERK